VQFGEGIFNESTGTFVGGRVIARNECAAGSCPSFYINDTTKYGNVRMNVTVFENGTIINKTLEITKMSTIKEIGYAFGAADVIYLYRFPTSNDNQTPPNDTSPQPEGKSNPAPYVIQNSVQPQTNSGSALSLAATITLIFVFLLMMHENTQ